MMVGYAFFPIFHYWMILFLGAAIFVLDMSSYTATEGQGSQIVFAVQSGILGKNVVVTVQTVPNTQATATGNKTFYQLTVLIDEDLILFSSWG